MAFVLIHRAESGGMYRWFCKKSWGVVRKWCHEMKGRRGRLKMLRVEDGGHTKDNLKISWHVWLVQMSPNFLEIFSLRIKLWPFKNFRDTPGNLPQHMIFSSIFYNLKTFFFLLTKLRTGVGGGFKNLKKKFEHFLLKSPQHDKPYSIIERKENSTNTWPWEGCKEGQWALKSTLRNF